VIYCICFIALVHEQAPVAIKISSWYYFFVS